MKEVQIRRGDIYYADLSPVVGSEQGGVRPVLVIQNDVGNRHSPTVICAAITSRMNKAKLPSRSLAIIWERCCESDLECLLLGREERVRLHELGMQLGSLDKKQETQIFLQYAEFLEEKRGGLLKEIQEKRRLCNLLGVTAGLFLTILIL